MRSSRAKAVVCLNMGMKARIKKVAAAARDVVKNPKYLMAAAAGAAAFGWAFPEWVAPLLDAALMILTVAL